MAFTRTDQRLTIIAVILAVPLEVVALRAFSQVPFDYEPPVKPSGVDLWTGMTTVLIHYPARFILATRIASNPNLMWAVLFVIGYVDLLLLFALLIALFKLATYASTYL